MCIVGENAEGRHSDKTAEAFLAHHKTEAEEDEHNCADTEIHQVFHYNISCVLCSGEAAFNHCKSALHKEHKRSAD